MERGSGSFVGSNGSLTLTGQRWSSGPNPVLASTSSKRGSTAMPKTFQQRHSSEGPESADTSFEHFESRTGNTNALLNLDISASNFMNAMNFDALAGAERNGVAVQDEDESPQRKQKSRRDIESGLSGQHSVLEQERLLQRFKKLREWQQQQQDLLMAQQQQQLLQLREEQERVHRVMAQQKQMQWGGASSRTENGVRSSPKKETTKTTSVTSPKRSEGHQINGRPAPVLPRRPPTPEEFREMGNPNLDSDSATVSSRDMENVEDDGVCSIPDTDSETDQVPEFQNGLFTHGFETGRPHDGAAYTSHPSQLNFPSQAQQMQFLAQLAAQKDISAHPNYLFSNAQMSNSAFSLPYLTQQQYLTGLHPALIQTLLLKGFPGGSVQDAASRGQNSAGVSHTNPMEVEEEIVLPKSRMKSKTSPSRHRRPNLQQNHSNANGETAFYPETVQQDETEHQEDVAAQEAETIEEETEWAETEEQEEVSDAEQDEANNTQVPVDDDDRPIEGIAAAKKTFEELLEEQLRKEEEKLLRDSQSQEVAGKRPFLRKGEGIARFNKPPAPRTRRPKSTGPTQTQSGSKADGDKPKPTQRPVSANSEKVVSKPKPTVAAKLTSRPGSGKTAAKNLRGQSSASASGLSDSKAAAVSKFPPRQPVPPAEPKKANSRGQLIKNQQQVSPKQVGPSPPIVHQSQTQSVGDASFQDKLKVKAAEAEYEANELEEFKILEELADDDVSFISDVSAVNKIVSQLKETKNGNEQSAVDTRQIHKPRYTTEAPNNERKLLQQLQQRKQKQQQKATPNHLDSNASTNASDQLVQRDQTVNNGPYGSIPSDKQMYEDQIAHLSNGAHARVMPQRKVAHLAARSPVNNRGTGAAVRRDVAEGAQTDFLQKVSHFSDSENSAKSEDGDSASVSSEEEQDSLVVENVRLHQRSDDSNVNWNNNETAGNALAADKALPISSTSDSSHTYQVLETLPHCSGRQTISSSLSPRKELSPEEQVAQREGGASEGKTTTNGAASGVHAQSDEFDFGDEEEWADSSHADELSTTLTNARSPHQSTESSEVSKTTVVGNSTANAQPPSLLNGHRDSQPVSTTPPPTSKLVSRLFPNLRPEPSHQQKIEQAAQQQKLETAAQANPAEGVQSKILREKLAQLETEIERFRRENASLTKLRTEREEGLVKLNKEMSEFEKQKEAELKRLEDFKTEETKKLKRERKLFDQYQKAARAIPDKKEREEIQNLKEQLADLQEELKRKEQRWTANTTRLRNRIEVLETENVELKEEVRILEKRRLEAWQQRDAMKSAAADIVMQKSSQKEDKQQTALAPTPAKEPPKLLASENALRLSSNTEDLKSALGGLSVTVAKQTAESSTRETGGGDTKNSLGNKRQHQQETAAAAQKKAFVFNVSNTVDVGDGMHEENILPDGKIEKVYNNGSREVIFPNGNRKQISSDGQNIIVSFFNGDVKQVMPDQRVVYYYSEVQTSHTTYPDGLEILHFPNNQVEKHYPDGTREILFPDNTIKYLFPSGVEESIFEDGTVLRVEKNGDKTMEFANGQREVHTEAFMRREFPDGTVKTVYPDGRHETQYSSGRLRVKDKDGNILVDELVT